VDLVAHAALRAPRSHTAQRVRALSVDLVELRLTRREHSQAVTRDDGVLSRSRLEIDCELPLLDDQRVTLTN
jgi:hypothetical protein